MPEGYKLFVKNNCKNFEGLQQVLQKGDKRLVGRGHRVVAQRLRTDPFGRLTLPAMGNTVIAAADEERHQQVKATIAVACEREWRQTRNARGDPKLLIELA